MSVSRVICIAFRSLRLRSGFEGSGITFSSGNVWVFEKTAPESVSVSKDKGEIFRRADTCNKVSSSGLPP
jgi:hypothetical protein